MTRKTKAIVPVHYAGVSCEMDTIMEIASRHGLLVVEDAAQVVNATYRERYLGTIGHLGTYSFHETKNFISGEGGAWLVNDDRFIERAEIIREKGTNRSKFFRARWTSTPGSISDRRSPLGDRRGLPLRAVGGGDTIHGRGKRSSGIILSNWDRLSAEVFIRMPAAPKGAGTTPTLFY